MRRYCYQWQYGCTARTRHRQAPGQDGAVADGHQDHAGQTQQGQLGRQVRHPGADHGSMEARQQPHRGTTHSLCYNNFSVRGKFTVV